MRWPTFRRIQGGEITNQLDYLFVTDILRASLVACDTSARSLVFDGRLSDHLPIVADFTSEDELLIGRSLSRPEIHARWAYLVGSIGEVVAAEALDLTLYPSSFPRHDAFDKNGDVQIKLTGGKSVSLYGTCERLVVLQITSPEEAEIVYDGSGAEAWAAAGPLQKNGQRVIRLGTLRAIAAGRS